MYGVSPAYFISRFGQHFTEKQIVESLPDLIEIGFDSFQLEVFFPERLGAWVDSGAGEVRRGSVNLGISPSQFVAHFLLNYFGTAEALESNAGVAEFAEVVRSLENFPECRVVTVPLPAFAPGKPSTGYQTLYDRTCAKLEQMVAVAERNSVTVALEILPYSVVDGSDGFLRLLDRLGPSSLGYNFDTGHAWAMKERVELLPSKLGNKITGTHLCDNDGGTNLSLTPGKGTIDWNAVLPELLRSGYRGSIDVEIHAPDEDVNACYGAGLNLVRDIWEKSKQTSSE